MICACLCVHVLPCGSINNRLHLIFLPARPVLARHYRYGTVSACVSVYYKSVFYESGWMVQAGFWHGGFLQLTTPCFKEIRVSTKIKELCLELRTYNIAMARWSSQHVVNLAQSSGRLAGKLDRRCSVGWKYLRWSTASLSHGLSVYVYSIGRGLSRVFWKSWYSFSLSIFLLLKLVVIPAKAFERDYVTIGVGLSVCLFVCYHDN